MTSAHSDFSKQHSTENTVTSKNHEEDGMTKAIEKDTAKVPSDIFLMLAGGAILGSLAFQLLGNKRQSLFLGQWAPTILCLGIYNKIVKAAEPSKVDKKMTMN